MKTLRFLITPFLLIALFMVDIKPADAQVRHDIYNSAIGLRLGSQPGLSFKTFTGGRTAFEGLVHARLGSQGIHGVQFTGLFEVHHQFLNIPRFHWFYGAGGHIGMFNPGFTDRERNPYTDRVVTLGIDGILGLEYVFRDLPITLGVDVKPYYDLINPGFGWWDGAVTLRYAFR